MILGRIMLAALIALLMSRGEAATPEPCDMLFVPDSYGLACTVETTDDGSWRLVVAPTEGPFSRFSRLSIRPLEESITEPRAWLRRQVTLDTGGVDETLRDIFESPDNPLSGELLTNYLDTMMDLVETVANSPLIGCGEGRPLADDRGYEIECDWGVGGIDKYLTMRLVEHGDMRYFISIEAMNPRRMRHLVAIANSFEGAPSAP